jgi:hypothetical protein
LIVDLIINDPIMEQVNQNMINIIMVIGAKFGVCLPSTFNVRVLSNSLFSRKAIKEVGDMAMYMRGCEYGSGTKNAFNKNTVGTAMPTEKYIRIILLYLFAMAILSLGSLISLTFLLPLRRYN